MRKFVPREQPKKRSIFFSDLKNAFGKIAIRTIDEWVDVLR